LKITLVIENYLGYCPNITTFTPIMVHLSEYLCELCHFTDGTPQILITQFIYEIHELLVKNK